MSGQEDWDAVLDEALDGFTPAMVRDEVRDTAIPRCTRAEHLGSRVADWDPNSGSHVL